MHVVYIIGKTANNYETLRFSMRSVEIHFPQNSGIVIIGEKPRWYQGEHHYVPDASSCPYINQWNKLLFAANLPHLSDTFLYCDDDFILLEPYTPSFYSNGTLAAKAAQHAHQTSQWAQCVLNTYRLFPNAINHLLHTPLPIHREMFIGVARRYQRYWSVSPSIVPRQAYTLRAKGLLPTVERLDVKVSKLEKAKAIKAPFMSTDEGLEGLFLYRYLRTMFLYKCKYEK